MVRKSSCNELSPSVYSNATYSSSLVFDHFKTIRSPAVDQLEEQQRNGVLLDTVNLLYDQLRLLLSLF